VATTAAGAPQSGDNKQNLVAPALPSAPASVPVPVPAATASATPTDSKEDAKFDQELFSLAWTLAHLAGNLIRFAVTRPKTIQSKSSAVDNVTETDVACEKLIIDAVRKRFPTHLFIAEESHKSDSYVVSDTPTWLIDPIDGTTNFMHGLPFVCVSIGVMVNKRIRCGVVHAPLLHETFHAIHGCGSWVTAVLPPPSLDVASTIIPPIPNYSVLASVAAQASTSSSAAAKASAAVSMPPVASASLIKEMGVIFNGSLVAGIRRLAVSGVEKVENAAFICEFGYERTAYGADMIFGVCRALLVLGVHAVRSFGSCALNTCMVASGRADCYWEGKDTIRGPKPWDVAAVSVIVNEAGGTLVDTDGSAFSLWTGRLLVAGSASLAAKIVTIKKTSDQTVTKQHTDAEANAKSK